MDNRIVCAAHRYPDGVIIIGARHGDTHVQHQWSLLEKTGWIREGRGEQGFVDQRGNFYNRKEAWKIAKAQGQIIRRVGGDEDGTLFSENLY